MHEQEAAASRPPRFYVPAPLPVAAGELVELDAEESRHAAKALRLEEGDVVELCDGIGSLLLGRIASVGKKVVSIEAASAPQQVRTNCLQKCSQTDIMEVKTSGWESGSERLALTCRLRGLGRDGR